MIEDSFIRMPKDEVIERCENAIAHIKKNRQADDDRAHRRVMNSRNKSWIRRLFKRPKVTLEDIQKEYEGYTDWPFYPSCKGWGALDTAERILRAAKASQDDVYLSSSDLYHIR